METITNRRRVSTSPAFGPSGYYANGYYVWRLIEIIVRDDVTGEVTTWTEWAPAFWTP